MKIVHGLLGGSVLEIGGVKLAVPRDGSWGICVDGRGIPQLTPVRLGDDVRTARCSACGGQISLTVLRCHFCGQRAFAEVA